MLEPVVFSKTLCHLHHDSESQLLVPLVGFSQCVEHCQVDVELRA